jgi:hypothetical protein
MDMGTTTEITTVTTKEIQERMDCIKGLLGDNNGFSSANWREVEPHWIIAEQLSIIASKLPNIQPPPLFPAGSHLSMSVSGSADEAMYALRIEKVRALIVKKHREEYTNKHEKEWLESIEKVLNGDV